MGFKVSHEYPTEVPPPGIVEAVSFNVTLSIIEWNEATPHDSALSQPVTSNKDPLTASLPRVVFVC
jgi:hypothetical protein